MSALLARIAGPEDLRALPDDALPALAAEIRRELIDSVCRTGGHLGPNLGVVELTIALHRVFRSPHDVLLWDTGHQAYVHKLLTGRRTGLASLRRAGGLSGYPHRAESEHDLVENSHASTALSYADGLAKAFALRGEDDRSVVAVVGDGALTGGLAWEALNNLGRAGNGRPVVVVVNDNGRSYAPTVGGVADHLAALRAGTAGPALFDRLGLGYLGPVDGHDVPAVTAALREARRRRAPTVVHCVTEKGRGHPPAERNDVDRMHSIGPAGTSATSGPSWTEVFAAEMQALAARRPDVVAVTAAMLDPTGLTGTAGAAPGRVFDVGIAEQHAVTSAAGLALGGLHPVVAVYATFLNRAFDQVLLDVALHRLPVTFVLDRAGITGSDGPSHHGMWDLSLLGLVPGLRVGAPRDGPALRKLFAEAVDESDGPTALRFPKGRVGPPLPALEHWGRTDVLHRAPDATVLLVPVGAMAAPALHAATQLDRSGVAATVVDPGWLLPVDPALLAAASRHRLVVTVEDNGVAGGYGDALARALRTARVHTDVLTLGLPQRFLPHGERADLLAAHGLDGSGIAAQIREALAANRPPVRALSRRTGHDSLRANHR